MGIVVLFEKEWEWGKDCWDGCLEFLLKAFEAWTQCTSFLGNELGGVGKGGRGRRVNATIGIPASHKASQKPYLKRYTHFPGSNLTQCEARNSFSDTWVFRKVPTPSASYFHWPPPPGNPYV